MSNKKKHLIAFNYFGAKYRHLDWLLPLLPESYSFVDVFGGSAVVILNRKPSKIEVFNDINKDVISFFEMLRTRREELLTALYFTPYSREEYKKSLTDDPEDDLERARQFFVSVNQGFASIGKTHTNSGWGYTNKTTRCRIAECVNRWLGKIPNLENIVDRLRTIQIEGDDFRNIFERYDTDKTLFYCDPPYTHDARTGKTDYKFEMTEQDHADLIELAKNIKGKIAISGYENPQYANLLTDFYKVKAPVNIQNIGKSPRQEILWTNYDPYDHSEQKFLFKREMAGDEG